MEMTESRPQIPDNIKKLVALKPWGLIAILILVESVFMPAAGFVLGSHFVLEDAAYISDIHKWRAERLKEINGEDGWTTLVGLFWLKEGPNKFRSDPDNGIVLPRNRSPRLAGSLDLDKEVV